MKNIFLYIAAGAALIAPTLSAADPSLECSIDSGSQVEIKDCLAATAARVDGAIGLALGYANESAADLDKVTERDTSVKALQTAQAAWVAYRDAHCEFVGSTFGGGSGTGIAIQSCRIELGRLHVTELMKFIQ